MKPKKYVSILGFELTPEEAAKVSGSVGAAVAIEARKRKASRRRREARK